MLPLVAESPACPPSSQPILLDAETVSPAILSLVHGTKVTWRHTSARGEEANQSPVCGLDYVRVGSKVRDAWESCWPRSVTLPAWDFIGRAQIGRSGCWEWVCVKCFHHPNELQAGSPPSQPEAHDAVRTLFEEAKGWSRANPQADWMSAGFDVASLVTLRAFLSSKGSCGHMVFLGLGQGAWQTAFDETKARLGLTRQGAVSNRLKWASLDH